MDERPEKSLQGAPVKVPELSFGIAEPFCKSVQNPLPSLDVFQVLQQVKWGLGVCARWVEPWALESLFF